MVQALFVFLSISLLSYCSKKSNTDTPAETSSVLSIDDVSKAEGNGGTANFTIAVRLDKPSSKIVTVSYATAEGFAKATTDFTPVNGTVTFQVNEIEKNIIIPIIADDIKEGNDDFKIVLANSTNAGIFKGTSIAVIENDDFRVDFTNVGYDAPTSYPGYTLAWADEFNATTLNTVNWAFENGDGCPNICGWGNNELEYYTDRSENLFFQDGKMIIEARKENFGGKAYTSSKIVSRGKKTFKFGRIDIRAKLPIGKGIWPAFWMLPQNNVFGGWPRSGELDIMEMIGHEANRSHGTLHFGPGPGSVQLNRSYTLPTGNFIDQFHVFSIEWKQNQIKWLIDGNVFSTFTQADFGVNNYPFNEEFFFIINLAVGGNWPGNPDVNTYIPQWLIVDYVRVYQ